MGDSTKLNKRFALGVVFGLLLSTAGSAKELGTGEKVSPDPLNNGAVIPDHPEPEL